ncbi:MAG: peptidylprolyl isomerase [Oscillospiraceae bacterium]|nr:peptidylprolyl isomerase [Oscillospiraceae bacterium]
MRLTGSAAPKGKKRIVKILTICAVFTLLGSLLFSGVYSAMSGYSSVIDADDVEMIQLEPPKSGDDAAVIRTTAGDLTFVLYPSVCPEAVANFKNLAETGYYDNSYVFSVVPDVYFEAGSPNADGSLKESDLSKPCERIPREASAKLWPLRGALCAPTTTADTGFFKSLFGKQSFYNGSRFLVADTVEMTEEMQSGLRENQKLSAVADAFIEHGGIPNFSMQMTVFGQLTDGFDVLDAITGSETVSEGEISRPKDEIRILSVEITQIP